MHTWARGSWVNVWWCLRATSRRRMHMLDSSKCAGSIAESFMGQWHLEIEQMLSEIFRTGKCESLSTCTYSQRDGIVQKLRWWQWRADAARNRCSCNVSVAGCVQRKRSAYVTYLI